MQRHRDKGSIKPCAAQKVSFLSRSDQSCKTRKGCNDFSSIVQSSSSKCVITDGVIGTQGTHSVRVCVHTKSREREAFVCAVYACMQMTVYCITACLCVCVRATAWMCINTQTYAMHGFKQIHVCVRPYGSTHTGAHTPRPVRTTQPKHEHQECSTFTLMHTGWQRASAPCQGPSTHTHTHPP